MEIPQYDPPTHDMQRIRYAEEGSIRMLWVQATNPAVSLPELHRIRSVLSQDRLFLVVQDIFRSETAELADVVLHAATWGGEDRHLHQRGPHGPPLGAGGRPTGGGALRPRHPPRLRPPARPAGQGRRTTRHVDDAGGGVRGL